MERYWAAAVANDLDAMHHLRAEALVVDFPQTGERLSGRDVVRAFEEGVSASTRARVEKFGLRRIPC
jgi:hypothetical protein